MKKHYDELVEINYKPSFSTILIGIQSLMTQNQTNLMCY